MQSSSTISERSGLVETGTSRPVANATNEYAPAVGATGVGPVTGSYPATQSNLQHAGGQQATPIQFKDCAQADGSVVAFPFEFGADTETSSSVWIGLEPHSPNCLYMGTDPETGDPLTSDELLDRREVTHDELATELKSYRAAIDELESFFDEEEDGLVVAEHSELTLRELEQTITATSYLLDQLFIEMEELGYAADFEYDPARYGDVVEQLIATIHEHYALFDALDPELPAFDTDDQGRPVVAPRIHDLESELDETPEAVDFEELYARAVRFDNNLHELIEESREVQLATPRQIDDDGTAILDTLQLLARETDDTDEVDSTVDPGVLAETLSAFLDGENNGIEDTDSGLGLTRELEVLLDDDTDSNADFIEELRALLAALEPTDVEVTFVDRMPNVTCGRCCYSYDTSRAADRVSSAPRWIANLLWEVISYVWEHLSNFDDWLEDKLPLDGFWYRVFSILVIVLLVIAIVLVGWKVGLAGAIAGAAKAALKATKAGLIRTLQNVERWKQLIRLLLGSDISCSMQ